MTTTQLLTWPGGQFQKDKFVKAFQAHRKADALIKGDYIARNSNIDEPTEFNGCAVGCVLWEAGHRFLSDDPHKAYEEAIGVPVWLAHLHDYFFESLPHPQNQEWAESFLKAIPVGEDLLVVKHKFLLWILTDKKHGSINFADGAGVKVTENVAALHLRAIHGDIPSSDEWNAARDAAGAARDAAGAAGDAAWAARDAAWAARDAARDAAWAARDAAWAARDAAWAAAWAARDAARDAAWAAARDAAWAARDAAWAAARDARDAACVAQSQKLINLLRKVD